MRVGVLAHGFMEWGGGVDFLRNFMSSLMQAEPNIEIYLLAPVKGPRLALRSRLSYCYRTLSSLGKIQYSASYDKGHLDELITGSGREVKLHEIDIGFGAIESAARRLSLEVLAPSFLPLPRSFPVPWLGYIYDFQHQYYPQLFAKADIDRRNDTFGKMLKQASAVVVNAHTVAEDIRRYHPEVDARVFVLPFNAAPQPRWLNIDAKKTQLARGISRPYFVICNQFWKHKDHSTAFAAFAEFTKLQPDIDLVCTGTAQDYRDPLYVIGLRRQIEKDRLSHRVHILGAIPKSEQISLLVDSIALIQPTLFEGGPGGGAVFDAISLGVRCLVSDIPTNRELKDPLVSFFAAGDADALCTKMLLTAHSPSHRLSRNDLLEAGRKRQSACGLEITKALALVTAKK